VFHGPSKLLLGEGGTICSPSTIYLQRVDISGNSPWLCGFLVDEGLMLGRCGRGHDFKILEELCK